MPWGVRYTGELGTAICERLARGESLRKMCAEPGYPDRHTIARWTREHPQFREQYEQARLLWADELFEEIAELAAQARQLAEDAEARGFNAHAAVGALREEIRAKMWVCARLRPDKYGDRVSTEITGPGGKSLIPGRQSDPQLAAQAVMLLMEGAAASGTATELQLPHARTRIEDASGEGDEAGAMHEKPSCT
jgi:hypothetical protein